MIVFLLIWTALLTIGTVLGFLAFLGKFSRIEREVFENLNKELFAVFESLKSLDTKVKTLEGKLETLEKNHAYDCSTLAGSLEQAENRIGQIYETEEGLRKDIDLLLRSTDEHPVLLPVERNKGGRPRKVVNINSPEDSGA